jgi:hypothetical protein
MGHLFQEIATTFAVKLKEPVCASDETEYCHVLKALSKENYGFSQDDMGFFSTKAASMLIVMGTILKPWAATCVGNGC